MKITTRLTYKNSARVKDWQESLKELWNAYVAAEIAGVLELPTQQQHDGVLSRRNALPKPSEQGRKPTC